MRRLAKGSLIGFLAVVTLFYSIVGLSSWRLPFSVQADRMDGVTEPGVHEDYVVFYSAGQLVKDGRGAELYNLDSMASAEERALGRPAGEGVLVYLNPPFFAAAFAPLTALPLAWASLVIFVIGCLLALISAAVLCRFLEVRDHKEQFAVWLAFLTLSSVPWLVAQGQPSLLLFLGWLGFAHFQSTSRQQASGASLALTLIKPQYALIPILLLVWNRQWKALFTLSGIATVLCLVSLVVSGPEIFIKYPQSVLETMRWYDEKGIHLMNMYGWSGYFARLLHSNSELHSVLTLTFDGATVALVAFASRDLWKPGEASFYYLMALALIATLLVGAHLYLQDLSLLALVIAFVVKAERQRGGNLLVWMGFAAALWLSELYARSFLMQRDFNLPTPLMAMLFLALVVRLELDRARARTDEFLPELSLAQTAASARRAA